MPKTVTLSIECTGVSASQFWSLTYGSKEFLQEYHTSVNKDSDAVIPDFEPQDDDRHPVLNNTTTTWSRVVEFTVPVKAPSFIMRLIGSASHLRVLETQNVSKVTGDGGCLKEVHVESKPRPQLGSSIGEGFTSDVFVKIVDESFGCRVVATVDVCATSAPYGMVGIVETFMLDTAKASLDELLQHMSMVVENIKDNMMVVECIERNVEHQGGVHGWLGLVLDSREKKQIEIEEEEEEEWTPSEYQSVYYRDDTHEDIVEALQEIVQKMDGMKKTLDRLVSRDMCVTVRVDSSVWWMTSTLVAGALVATYIMTRSSSTS